MIQLVILSKKRKMIEKIKKISIIISKSAPYLNIVYSQASAVIIFSIIGYFLDLWFSTEIIFTLIGLIIGLGFSLYLLAKTIWNK